MTMYEILKLLQPVAEQLGEIENVNMHEWGDRRSVSFEGIIDSASFELELTIKPMGGTDGTV